MESQASTALNSLTARLQNFFESHFECTPDAIHGIQAEFLALPRSSCTPEALVALKLRMQQWRRVVLNRVLDWTAQNPCARAEGELFQMLGELQLRPVLKDLRKLAHWATGDARAGFRRAAGEYFATVGEPALARQVCPEISEGILRLAGPERVVPIAANVPSRWSLAKWGALPDADFYAFGSASASEREGVRFRGLHFLPGDFLICNVNRDGNGVYTAIIEPRSYGYHMGIFATLSHEGRCLPVVIETYQRGVRVVPLKTFLSAPFSTYVEVSRLREKPPGYHAFVNEFAAVAPAQVRGYNFDTEDPDRSYLSCTTVGRHMLELAGTSGIRARARYIQEPRLQANLDVLEFGVSTFLSLTDYLTDPAMEFVGAVDNDHFEGNLTRELVERQFVRIFKAGELKLSRLPLLFQLNRWAIRQIRAGNLIGRLILTALGFTRDNFPKGPEKVLAVIEIFEHQIAAAVRKAGPRLQGLWNRAALVDVDALARDPAVLAVLEHSARRIASGFVREKPGTVRKPGP